MTKNLAWTIESLVMAATLLLSGPVYANDWPKWPAAAYDDYLAQWKCRAETPGRCTEDDCKAIEKQADWIGALCFADEAKVSGQERERRKQVERAFSLFEKSHSKGQLAWIQGYADLGKAKGDARIDLLENFLRREIMDAATATAYIKNKEKATKDMALLKERAEGGDAQAQDELGAMYAEGRGVKKDYAEAVVWFRKAAEQGEATGQNELGVMYAEGRGVTQDYAQAVTWFRKAAEQGDATAQTNLGIKYDNGQGVKQDNGQALVWYRKAAEQGNATAQRNLGTMYAYGKGVKQDYTQAVVWYRKAAEQGDATAQNELGVMYYDGKGVAQNYAQALEWFHKAAEQRDVTAQKNLGLMYANGQGTKQDYGQALVWYHKAAEQGDATAQRNLGIMYADGDGVVQDYAQAIMWYRKAAEQGEATAQNNLGAIYANGQGVLQDYAQAVIWYRKAAAQGDDYAQRNLANFYRHGLGGLPQSNVTAYAWMNLAAASGNSDAPKERDEIAAQLSTADLQKAQALSRAWKSGQAIPEIHDAARLKSAPRAMTDGNVPANGPFPAKPERKPGVTSCNTRCVNAECYRTYDDGRQVHFQAKRVFEFGEWKWDSGEC
jgi:TPR repeat protein